MSNHGIKIGMGRTQSQRPRIPLNKDNEMSNEEKLAVECGYSSILRYAIEIPLAFLHIWHYNPAEEEAGHEPKAANTAEIRKMKVSNGFHLDSKEPESHYHP